MRARTLFAVFAVLLMVLGSSGCLSLESVKDALLWTRDEPEVVYWKVTPPPVDVYWEADRPAPPVQKDASEPIKVKPGAKWMKLTYAVQLPSSALGPIEIINRTYYFEPLVTMRLQDNDGDVYWAANFTEDAADTVPIMSPAAGVWTLRLEFKGYGAEVVGFEMKDTLVVVVDLYEPK